MNEKFDRNEENLMKQINEKIESTNESTREKFRQINEKIDSTKDSTNESLR